jgi:hypothetical protein
MKQSSTIFNVDSFSCTKLDTYNKKYFISFIGNIYLEFDTSYSNFPNTEGVHVPLNTKSNCVIGHIDLSARIKNLNA